MNINFMPILVLGGLGAVFGIGLAIASRIFQLKENITKLKVLELLPGANCGACGLAGCESYAELLSSDKDVSLNKCTVGGAELVEKLGALFGREATATGKKIAVIMCSGGENCTDRFTYSGVNTCYAVNLVFGGHKSCIYGCLGLGDCVKSCPFGAITQDKPGTVPVINPEKCTGCGLCVNVCPKKIIELVEEKFTVHIKCKSIDKGTFVRKICKVGCIGCGVCVKICPVNDIVLENNLAKIKYITCDNCGKCVEKCLTKTIQKIHVQ